MKTSPSLGIARAGTGRAPATGSDLEMRTIDSRKLGRTLLRLCGGKLVELTSHDLPLATPSKSYLLGLMARCQTGKNRIRGMLPFGARVENKTGTLNGLTTDVGFITLPDGRRLAVAFFARYGANRPQTIAQAARTIYDGFSTWLQGGFTSSYGTPAFGSR